jgi:predicted phosphohydrolase
MTKKNIRELISGAVNSASMRETSIESEKLVEDEKLFKKKMIQLPVELDNRIKKIYTGTCSSYILMAIYEKLKRDES